jgi:hypothetical protein
MPIWTVEDQTFLVANYPLVIEMFWSATSRLYSWQPKVIENYVCHMLDGDLTYFCCPLTPMVW